MRRSPGWARQLLELQREIQSSLLNLIRKVHLIMALDTTVLARVLAGAGALAEQALAAAAREQGHLTKIADLQAQLGSERATEAAEDQAEAEANDALRATAEAVEKLVKGPETPAVVIPAPEEAPAVVEGTEPVVAPDGGEVSEEPAVTPEPPAGAPGDAVV